MSTLSDRIAASKKAASSKPKDDGAIINRVAAGAIETFNLEDLWDSREIVEFDIAPFLFQGLIVKEVPYREHVREQDWSAFEGKHVAVFCSADAIVPTWAWMLVASKLEPLAASVHVGRRADLTSAYFARALAAFDFSKYEGKNVVVKGCGTGVVPTSAYALATVHLQRVAKKLMFGEACSSVPLWRKK